MIDMGKVLIPSLIIQTIYSPLGMEEIPQAIVI